ncbi:hypothetical protein [Rhodococcoides fascians]|uniref:hypothetical protein n=1 Tax=Rhodococcoides fascians TaxID=1828 RepID=UPI002782DB06|nr:hypothetical protein [Rhodococcus fascians]MDQ0284822.1 hypothetical protein [Rhodococcus fascians]
MGTVDPRSITPPAAHGDVIEAGWSIGLAGHRTAEEIPEIVERFRVCGITAEILDEVLTDPNRLLHSPDRDGEQWAQQYGGPAGAALLVSELLAYLAHQHRVAARIRVDLVTGMVATGSVSTVAHRLGIPDHDVTRLPLAHPDVQPSDIDAPSTEGLRP